MAVPAPYMAVIFFVDQDGRGWSEKYWIATSLTRTDALTLLTGLCQARAGVATVDIQLVHCKLQTSQARSVWAFSPDALGAPAGLLAGPTMPSDVGLDIRLSSTSGYYSRVFLRGIPEANVNAEEFVPTSAFGNAYNNYASFIVSQGQFVVRTSLVTPGALIPVVNAAAGHPKGILLTIPSAQSLTVGQTIRVHGAPIPGYNGLKKVVSGPGTVPLPNTYTLGGASPISDVASSSILFYSIPTYNTAGVTGLDILGVTNRRVGRPFGLARGRARTLFSLRA